MKLDRTKSVTLDIYFPKSCAPVLYKTFQTVFTEMLSTFRHLNLFIQDDFLFHRPEESLSGWVSVFLQYRQSVTWEKSA